LNAGSEAFAKALTHKAAGVRRAAAMTLPAGESNSKKIIEAKLLKDSDPQVRMAALLALSESQPSEEAARAIFEMVQDPANSQDRWIPDAAIAAAARNDAAFLRAILASYKP